MKKIAGAFVGVLLVSSLSVGMISADSSHSQNEETTIQTAQVSAPELGGWDEGWRNLLERKMKEVL